MMGRPFGEGAQMTDTISCQSCGASNPSNAAFCTACGAKVESSTGTAGAPPSQRGVGEDDTRPDVAEDVTRIDTPIDSSGQYERTQVFPSSPPTVDPAERTRWDAPAPPDAPSWSAAGPGAPEQQSWQPPPPATPQPGGWQPPPPPPAEWAGQPPGPSQGWAAPAPPTGPPGQWQQAPPSTWSGAGTAPGPAPGASSGSATLAALLAFVGAAVLVACVFTAWINGNGFPKVTGWELLTEKSKARQFKSPDPALLLAIAAASIAVGGLLVAGVSKALMRVLLALAGIGAVTVIVIDYLSIKDTVKKTVQAGTEISFQYGFWLGVVGAVILIVAAVMPARKRT